MPDSAPPNTPTVTASGFQAGVTDSQSAGFVSTTSSVPANPSARFTEEDLQRVRNQEKDKLYPQIDDLKARLKTFEDERQTRLDAEKKAKEDAEAAERKRQEQETDVRTLLEQREQEWRQQLEAERLERERAFALLDQERALQAVETYRQQVIAANSGDIIPELLDLVSGNSKEEIDASIAGLKDRSSRILNAAQEATHSARQNLAGVRITAPSAGPLDTNSGQRTFTPEEIRNMSVSEFAKHRDKLLGTASAARNRGLFG